MDIEKGSLILNENPKICADIEEVEGSSGKFFIMSTEFDKKQGLVFLDSLMKTFQIEAMIALITKMAMIFS